MKMIKDLSFEELLRAIQSCKNIEKLYCIAIAQEIMDKNTRGKNVR